jgi:predicted nucleotidyltransferase
MRDALVKTQFTQLADTDQLAASEFADRLREQLEEPVHSIVLFGSRARGDAAQSSDMDLIVVVPHANPATRRAVRYLAVEVWLKYGIYLSTRVWSQEHWQRLAALRTQLYRNIQRDGIVL